MLCRQQHLNDVDKGSNLLPQPFTDIMLCVVLSVSNGSGLPGCGPGLEPDRMVQSGLLPGKQGYPPGSGTGSNRTAVPFYGSSNFRPN